MNIDDLLCVGVTSNILFSSTIGRNKNRIPAEVLKAIITGSQQVIDQLNSYGISIYSTGGETADVGDLVKTIIVDSTVVARIKRSEIINNSNIKSGDLIIGLSSSGKALYEDEFNSGIGSNGLTSARHDVFGSDLKNKYPETYDSSIPSELIYSGSKKITQKIKSLPLDIGKMVLSPTRTYAPIIKKIFDQVTRAKIHGMIPVSYTHLRAHET